MASLFVLSVFLGCFSLLDVVVIVDGCQRQSQLLAIAEDVVTLPCRYDKLKTGNVSLTPSWVLFSADLKNATMLTFGPDIHLEYQNSYSVTDDREKMDYNLQITTASMMYLTQLYICGLSADGENLSDLYDGYTFTVLQQPNCSLKRVDKKVNLGCSWNPSILPLPIVVSWVQIRHPDILDDENINQYVKLNKATNSSFHQFTLSTEHYGDSFACVAKTETSNNTVIGCSYVPLQLPHVTITQHGDAVADEDVLFACNTSGLLTKDVVYSWYVNNFTITELDQDHFKLITDSVLKIIPIELMNNVLDIRCSVAEGNVVHKAELSLNVQYRSHSTPNHSIIIGISVASVVAFTVVVVIIVFIIKRLQDSRLRDSEATNVTPEKTAKDEDSYQDLEFPHISPTYESVKKTNTHNKKAGESSRRGKTKTKNVKQSKTTNKTKEAGHSKNEYLDLDFSHASPEYESIQTGAQHKVEDGGVQSKDDPCYVNHHHYTNDRVMDTKETSYANVI